MVTLVVTVCVPLSNERDGTRTKSFLSLSPLYSAGHQSLHTLYSPIHQPTNQPTIITLEEAPIETPRGEERRGGRQIRTLQSNRNRTCSYSSLLVDYSFLFHQSTLTHLLDSTRLPNRIDQSPISLIRSLISSFANGFVTR